MLEPHTKLHAFQGDATMSRTQHTQKIQTGTPILRAHAPMAQFCSAAPVNSGLRPRPMMAVDRYPGNNSAACDEVVPGTQWPFRQRGYCAFSAGRFLRQVQHHYLAGLAT